MDALWPVKAIHLRAFPGLKIETWGTQISCNYSPETSATRLKNPSSACAIFTFLGRLAVIGPLTEEYCRMVGDMFIALPGPL